MKVFKWLLLTSTVFNIIYSLPITRDTLPCGLVVLTYKTHQLPFIELRWVCYAGSAYDPKGKEGLANLTNKMLTRGTKSREAYAITSELEFLGATLYEGVTKDIGYLHLRFLSKDTDKVLAILADILQNPLFSEIELEKLKTQTILEIKEALDYPYDIGNKKFFELLLKDHPYAHDVLGDTQAIRTITSKDVQEFYHKYYTLNNSFLVVAGDFDHKELLGKLNEHFKSLSKGNKALPIAQINPGPFAESPRGYIITKPELNQSYVFLGFYGIPESSKDLIAVRVMNFILGGSPLVSRIGNRVRESAGLAYDVRSGFYRWRYGGVFIATTQTSDPVRAINYIVEEIKKLTRFGITKQELSRAQTFYLGNFPFNFDSMRERVNFLQDLELYGRELDFWDKFKEKIKALSVDQINSTAQKYLFPDNYLLVIVTNLPKDSLNIPGINWLN
ncbi:MAG: insulinase family protein [candidate division WOR-3 bacterium]|nr:insulinase family protein [candidate division WOR-3 bacterium]MDW7988306.1 pitrilysin family protein [candidate division WOR-3 bacterium]